MIDGENQPSLAASDPLLDLTSAQAEDQGIGLTYATTEPDDTSLPTIGEVLVGEYVSPVETDDRILFVPVGMGSLDVTLAEHVHENSTERNVAHEFAFV